LIWIKPVHAELVEALLFFLRPGIKVQEKGQCFDKLSMSGFG
jgi:hypothetical protein